MYNIKIGRFVEDPTVQGVVEPEDRSWQLVIDKDGYPHLYVAVKLEDEPGVETGFFCVEDLLPDDCKIKDLMQGSFGGKLPPEEEQAAYEEWIASKEKTAIPCPR